MLKRVDDSKFLNVFKDTANLIKSWGRKNTKNKKESRFQKQLIYNYNDIVHDNSSQDQKVIQSLQKGISSRIENKLEI